MTPALTQTLHEWMRLIMRHSMRNFILFAKEKNYSIAQLNAMFRIHHKGACGVSDLGEEMGVTSAAASQLLEKLVQGGLASRAEDPQDRRNKVVMLTDAGEQIVQESMAARQGWLVRLVELLSPSEQEQVNAALQLLIEKTTLLDEQNLDSVR
jgi:DNA-binding MarR family transcriptional regulator